ncbi:MAG: hypothetical protein ACC661_06350 [Verrucomicrobiales bacterium]
MERASAKGRLAHAYLASGGSVAEREDFALRLIALVNGDRGPGLDALASDSVRVVRPASKSRRISVAQMRELESSMHMAAPAGKTRFAIIEDADRMGVEAENAFLKTLEEPPPRSLILLLSPHPQQLLETVLSRCIRIPLMESSAVAPVSDSERLVIRALEEHFREGENHIAGALGLVGRFAEVLKATRAEIAATHEGALKKENAAYKQRTEGDWLGRREDYYKALTETVYRAARSRLIDLLMSFLGDAIRLGGGAPGVDLPESREITGAVAARYSGRELHRRFLALERLRTLLETNAHEKLVLEVCFLEAFG